MCHYEATGLNLLTEVIPVIAAVGVCGAEVKSTLVEILLDLIQQILDPLADALVGDGLLLQRISAHHLYRALLDVAGSAGKANRYALHLVLRELPPRLFVVSVVVLHLDVVIAKLLDERLHQLGDLSTLLITLVDRDDHYVNRSQSRRQHQSVVVRVGHDQGAHQASRYAP